MNRISRSVNNDATVIIDKISYDVPMEFIRQKIEVRYLPKRKNSFSIDYSRNGGKNVSTILWYDNGPFRKEYKRKRWMNMNWKKQKIHS